MKKSAWRFLHHRVALAAAIVFVCGSFARAQAPPEASAPAVPAAGPGAPATVVARVNGVAITGEDLATMARRLEARTKPGSRGGTTAGQLRDEALRRLIFQELLYQRARATGVSAPAADVEAAVSRIRDGGDREAKTLTEAGLRTLVERNLVLERFLAREVTAKIAVSEAELKSLYERRRPGFRSPERISVTDLLFFLDPAVEASRAQAGAVLARLRADPAHDARALAPDASFIVQSRELKPAEEPQLAEAARRLAPGEISGLLSVDGNIHVLRLETREPERERPFEEVRPLLERELRGARERALLLELETELRQAARIEIVGVPGSAP